MIDVFRFVGSLLLWCLAVGVLVCVLVWAYYLFEKLQEQASRAARQRRLIESKHSRLRTRIKGLVRRTICFSKTGRMHDLVIGLFINRYEFGLLL